MITLEQIKNIVIDIKSDDEWVNDSQTQAEYKGVCDGLDMLVNHLEVIESESKPITFDEWLGKCPVPYNTSCSNNGLTELYDFDTSNRENKK